MSSLIMVLNTYFFKSCKAKQLGAITKGLVTTFSLLNISMKTTTSL